MNIHVSLTAYTSRFITGRHSRRPKTPCHFVYVSLRLGSRELTFCGQNVDWNYRFSYRNHKRELSED